MRELGFGRSFADAGEGFFEAVDVVDDGAEETDLAFGTRFSDGDGDGVFVDIQAEVECNSLHGVVVRLYSQLHDESERIPAPERGGSCGSAQPPNPQSHERQLHRFFQPQSWGPGARHQP